MRLRRRSLRLFFNRLFEVVFRHLQVVLHRHGHAVADPCRCHVGTQGVGGGMSIAPTREQGRAADLQGNFMEKIWALDTRLYRPDPTMAQSPR